jgi:hypothetical protein
LPAQEAELLGLQLRERQAVYHEMTGLVDYFAAVGDLTVEQVENIMRSRP